MSFIGSMFGQNGTGLNFRASKADLVTPTTAAQADQTYKDQQDALAQQQSLIQALQGQNGIQNQSSVFNQLQSVANGQGPNPAQAMLANATGANVANQAALMAGQRGASANPALIARLAAQQGGNLQQQAAGQGAALQAQQSLGALNQLGGIAGQQVGQQQSATGALNQFAQSGQQNILNAIAQQNQAKVANEAQANGANANIAGIAAQGQQGLLGGLLGGAGSVLGKVFAKGGEVTKMAEGGSVNGPKSSAGKFFADFSKGFSAGLPTSPSGAGAIQQGMGNFVGNIGQGISNLVTPSPAAVQTPSVAVPGIGYMTAAAEGGSVGDKLKQGGKVPGTAKVKGDSYSNDNVKALLSPGEIVLPRSVTQSADPVSEASKFVAAIVGRQGLKKSKKAKK